MCIKLMLHMNLGLWLTVTYLDFNHTVLPSSFQSFLNKAENNLSTVAVYDGILITACLSSRLQFTVANTSLAARTRLSVIVPCMEFVQ